jgi:hypothetical protein
MLDDYIRWDGVELINNPRLSDHVDQLGIGFFQCVDECPTLGEALETLSGVKPPDSYLIEDAPWYHDGSPESRQFAGVHVLDVSGAADSTWTVPITEGLRDGGYSGYGRHRTREMVFRVLLIGTTAQGVDYGFDWLASTLKNGNYCRQRGLAAGPIYRDYLPTESKAWWPLYKDETSIPADDDVYEAPLVDGEQHSYTGLARLLSQRLGLEADFPVFEGFGCENYRMDFFESCPDADSALRYFHFMVDVVCSEGPTWLTRHTVSDGTLCEDGGGGAWAEIEFTLTALNPFWFNYPQEIGAAPGPHTYEELLSFFDVYRNELPISADNVYEAPLLYNQLAHTYSGLWEAMWLIKAGNTGTDDVSVSRVVGGEPFQWTDPDCDPLPTFPPLPALEEFFCSPLYTGPWDRRVYPSGALELPDHHEGVVTVQLESLGGEFKDVRLRMVPEGFSIETGWEVQFYVHYLAAGATLRLDGVRRSAYMWQGTPGSANFVMGAASHLISSDGQVAPYEFPSLLCGRAYTVVLDVPTAYDANNLGLSVFLNGRG